MYVGTNNTSTAPHHYSNILAVNEKNVGNLEAFQLSDQALKLQREGMFMESPKPDKIQLRQPVIVEGAEATLVDYHFFLVTVSITTLTCSHCCVDR